jgi:hypothetical protein
VIWKHSRKRLSLGFFGVAFIAMIFFLLSRYSSKMNKGYQFFVWVDFEGKLFGGSSFTT